MDIELSMHRLRRGLLLLTGAVAAAGLCVELAAAAWDPAGRSAWAPALVPLLSLSYEANLPTWYVVCLHAACALLLGLHAVQVWQRRAPHRARWTVLAGLFAYISADELIQIHEAASGWLDTGGVLYFGWVVPAAAVVAVLGLWYLPLVRSLPARTRRRVITAGAVFVAGALLMELPLGHWTWREGSDNLVYALLDWVEETLELTGVTLFLLALVDLPGRDPDALRISIAPP